MEKMLMYWLADHQSENLENINELAELLDGIGIKIKIKEFEDSSKGIKINYDIDEIERKLKRNAGRKHIDCLVNMTVEEVRERMNKGESAKMIASELGISRSTLFRKLKYAEEHDIEFLL